MGEHADDVIDQIIDCEWTSWRRYKPRQRWPQLPKGSWMQKDGTIIKMSDMTEKHLINTINHCKRIGALVKLHELEVELEARNEGNQNLIEDDV